MNETTNGNTSPDSANQDSTRRQFIGTSLSMAAASVGAGAAAFPAAVHAEPSKTGPQTVEGVSQEEAARLQALGYASVDDGE